MYLRSVASEFDGKVAQRIVSASRLYQRIADELEPAWVYAPFTYMITEANPWTREMRLAQAKVLKAAEQLERQAIEEI